MGYKSLIFIERLSDYLLGVICMGELNIEQY